MRLLIILLTFACTRPLLSEGWDLDTCYRMALENSPKNQVAREGVSVAAQDVGVAKSAYFPQVGLKAHAARWQTYAFIPTQLRDFDTFMFKRYGPFDDYRAAVESQYLLYDFGKRCAELKAALAQKGVAKEEAERIKREILLNVAVAFYTLAANLEMEAVAEKNLKRSEDHLLIAQKRKEAGAVPAADLFRSQVDVANGKQELVKAASLVQIAKGSLNNAIGLNPDHQLAIASESPEAVPVEDSEIVSALSCGIQHRPEVKASCYHLKVLLEKIERAKGASGPDVVAQGSYGWRDEHALPKEREFGIGVSVSMPLFTGFRLSHEFSKAKHEYCLGKGRHEQLLLDIQQQIWKAFAELKEGYEIIQTTVAQVADAKESVRLASERYESGAGTITDLLDAQHALNEADAVFVRARWNFQIAKAVYLWSQGCLLH